MMMMTTWTGSRENALGWVMFKELTVAVYTVSAGCVKLRYDKSCEISEILRWSGLWAANSARFTLRSRSTTSRSALRYAPLRSNVFLPRPITAPLHQIFGPSAPFSAPLRSRAAHAHYIMHLLSMWAERERSGKRSGATRKSGGAERWVGVG